MLDVPLSMVSVTYGDTKTAPFAGMSAGSKTTYTVGRAVKLAAEDARRQMLDDRRAAAGVRPPTSWRSPTARCG